MAVRQRDKVVRTLTLRQAWPRNMGNTLLRPRWQALNTRSPFPSNILYGRPRSIDRTPPEPDPEPEVLSVTVSAQGEGAGASAYDFVFTITGGTPPLSFDPGDGSAAIPVASVPAQVDYDYVSAKTVTWIVTDSGDPQQTASSALEVE